MAHQSLTPPVNTPYTLTEKEWLEIKDCSSALFAVVGIFLELPNHAEVGGIEALQSVQSRLDLAVSLAANRFGEGGSSECPLCGHVPRADPEGGPPQGSPTPPPPPPQSVDDATNGSAEHCSH